MQPDRLNLVLFFAFSTRFNLGAIDHTHVHFADMIRTKFPGLHFLHMKDVSNHDQSLFFAKAYHSMFLVAHV